MIGSMFRKAWYSDSATLSLDFTTGVLDSRLTFTRSSTTATYIDSSGYVASASTDVPRFDHDPSTLAPRGLLIEGQATNLLLQSNDWNTTWNNPAPITWDGTTYTTAPDGTNTAKQITVTAGSSSAIGQAVATGTNRTISVWLKAGSLTSFSIGAFDSGGTAWGNNADSTCSIISGPGSVSQQVGGLWSITGLSTTQWTRIQIFRSSTFTTFLAYPGSSSGTINGTAFMWGMQLENNNWATSLIITTTSTATRDPDNCVMTGTDFSSWFNASEGTFLAEYEGVPSGSTSGFVWHADDGTNNQRLFLSNATGNPRNRVLDGGSTQCSLTYSSVLMTSDGKNAFAFAANDFAGSTNGGTVLTDTVGTVPAVDRIAIGSLGGTGSYIDTAISKIKFWPTRLPDATLQSITT